MKRMTPNRAKKIIDKYFTLHTEARSIWQEVTADGVFTKDDVDRFEDDELIAVAEDLEGQMTAELY